MNAAVSCIRGHIIQFSVAETREECTWPESAGENGPLHTTVQKLEQDP